ncbi:MAG: ATP-grasp domain-containing protein, partial [Pseudomonadota bacterium]
IAAMGDKITSKRIAEQAGVNSIPAHLEAVSDAKEACKIAKNIGYPVMLKASAGGGGKGMRIAWNDDEVHENLTLAMSESKRSFGDDRVFIEKYVQSPRHIEIQILADTHGNIVYLGERECSLQRRHQKIIEEAPSPFVTAELRAQMGEQAVNLARAVGYVSAGTVEFIVDEARNFYFLEMNTRLQVEHPVTEEVFGVDLAQWMLRIAQGEKLDFSQKSIVPNGWAMEARLYAEDSARGFVPSTGLLTLFHPPKDVDLRLDSGIQAGMEVMPYYDPMLAKLIVTGNTRAEANANLVTALAGFSIEGVESNLGILEHIARSDEFSKGAVTTNFMGERYGDAFCIDDATMLDDTIMAVLGLHGWLRVHGMAGDDDFYVFCENAPEDALCITR